MAVQLSGELVLLPGLGATCELLEPQRRFFGSSLTCAPWIEPAGPNEPLDAYVRRWSEQVRDRLDPDRPLFLGGVSFGGITALEMARHLRPRAVLLIASCLRAAAIPRRTRRLARLESALPEWVVRRLLPVSSWVLAWGEPLRPQDRRQFYEALVHFSVPGRIWSERALLRWDFAGQLESTQRPVYRIHGRKDPIFPAEQGEPDAVPVDLVEGGHLINLTHAEAVNEFLLQRIREHGE